MVDILDPACELLLPWTKEIYLCNVAPLQYLHSDLLPPPPLLKENVHYTLYTDSCVAGVGRMLNCTVDHILQEFYTLFLTRFRTYKIVSPPQTKMTSKDDMKGLVSLKFLRPWISYSFTAEIVHAVPLFYVSIIYIISSFSNLYYKLRRYDMNGRSKMQGGKNWILPKDINANRFF
jgi:hypothetical protein